MHGFAKESRTASSACPGHPLVSIVLCTVGSRPSLRRCIESLLNQDCSHFEILVVFNSELDRALPHSIVGDPLRILYEPRRGVCAARNHAIPATQGRILAFVDDDIVAHPNWLHELLKGFEDPLVACATGRVIVEGQSYFDTETTERLYSSERALSAWSLDSSDPNWYRRLFVGAAGFGCNMAFRKDFLEKCHGFPEDLGAGSVIGTDDENYMFFRVLKQGFRIHHTPQAVVSHFFGDDPSANTIRLKQIYAGSVAFRLKLLVEEEDVRWTTLRFFVGGIGRTFRRFLRVDAQSRGIQENLTRREKLRAYLKGASLYWKSRWLGKCCSQRCGVQ